MPKTKQQHAPAPTADATDEIVGFEALGLHESVLAAITDAGYTTPTPIQRDAIPLARRGRDLIGLAQTGTGKTAAFTLPIIDRLIGGPRRTRALILTPTRELCVQVEESFRKYAQARADRGRGGVRRRAARAAGEEAARRRGRRRRHAGPVDRPPRAAERGVRRPRGARARRGGPHARHGLRAADQPHRRARCRSTARRCCSARRCRPKSRRSRASTCASRSWCRSGVRSAAASTVTHAVYPVPREKKNALLVELLTGDKDHESVLIFTRTKHGADRVVRDLEKAGVARDGDARRQDAGAAHAARSRTSRTARSACWWRPTSRSAGSTSRASRT